MPRLKLTIEYDGTGFRGWARQPGARTVEAELRRAVGELYGTFAELAVAGRTDTGVHALANVVSVDVLRRPAGRPRSRGVEHGASGRRGGDGGRGGAGRVQRPLRRALEVVSLPDLAPAPAVGLRGEAVALVAAVDRCRRAGRERPGCSSASTTSARSRRPRHSTEPSCGRCESAQWRELGEDGRRLRDHRRLVPASHGANARRLDARGPRSRPAARRASAQRRRRHGAAARPLPHERRLSGHVQGLSPAVPGV